MQTTILKNIELPPELDPNSPLWTEFNTAPWIKVNRRKKSPDWRWILYFALLLIFGLLVYYIMS